MPPPATGTQAVDRAAELLSLVIESTEPRGFTDLVHESGLAKSTASRLLQALERHGLLLRDDSGQFRPGALFSLYALRHEPTDGLVDIAGKTLRRIGDETGETVNLAVPRAGLVVEVAQIDSAYLLGATNWVGTHVPAHCSAQGKVLYAYGALTPPEEPLEPLTPHTITEPSMLGRELRQVRRQGYAVSVEELEVGLVAVAAPIRTRGSATVAAIGVTGPSARMVDRTAALGRLLVTEARRLSRQLGYRPEHDTAA